MSSPRAELRRQVLLLLVSVVALDVVALLVRHYAGIAERGRDANVWFTGGWMVATLLVVLPRLMRIRAVRDAARRARLQQRA